MSITHGIVVALTLAVGTPSVASEAQRRKPTVEIELPVLRRMPPRTLQELLSNVDLAVHVEILSSQPHIRQIPGGSEHITTFVAEVVETGRKNRSVGSKQRIRIVQRGGVFQEPDRVLSVSEEGNPLLVAGRSYLLTLAWDDQQDVYFLAFGADSVFEIQASKVFPRGRGTAARELAGKDLKEAIRRIK